eukprot:scaffold210093_cov19-Tisochrysis_lutea.AAC.1
MLTQTASDSAAHCQPRTAHMPLIAAHCQPRTARSSFTCFGMLPWDAQGMPNAGKSSLLKALTGARAKVSPDPHLRGLRWKCLLTLPSEAT